MAELGRDHQLYEQADRARRQGEWDIAQRYVEALLRINPHHVRGAELLRQIKIERAQSGLEWSERIKMALSSSIKTLLGKHEAALEDLELLYRRDPTKVPAALAYAQACIKLNRWDLALEPLESAHRANYKNVKVAELLVETYRRLKQYEEAQRTAQALMSISKNKAARYAKLVKDIAAEYQAMQIELERLTKARAEQERAQREKEQQLAEKERIQLLIKECAANPDNQNLKLELVDLLIETGQFSNAIKVFKPIADRERRIDMWEKLAKLYEATHNYEELAETYKRLQQISNEPSKYELPLVKARLEVAQQKSAANPTNVALREHVEKLSAQLREIQIHELRKKKRENPGDTEVILELARVLRADKRYDDAIREYQELARIPSYAFVASHELGRCFLDKGLSSLGVEWLETALTKLPQTRAAMSNDAKSIYYTLGEYYLTIGETAKGLSYWKTLYEHDITYRDIQQRYERAFQGADIGPPQDVRLQAQPTSAPSNANTVDRPSDAE